MDLFFAEMMVRGEEQRLADRFRQIYQLTAATSVVALAAVIAINKPFVSVWADSSLAWPLPLSIMLAAVVFVNTLTRCSSDLIVHSKNIAAFRYVYFVEAISFVALALWMSTHFGFYGVLTASFICLLAFRTVYTTWRMSNYFRVPASVFWWAWLKNPIIAGLALLPFVLSAEWLSNTARDTWIRLLITLVWVGIPATVAFFLVACPTDVKTEISRYWRLHFLSWRR